MLSIDILSQEIVTFEVIAGVGYFEFQPTT